MGLFTRQQQEHDTGRIHYILKMAFERVKGDMQHIFHWVNYFHQKHQQHDERLARLEQNIVKPGITQEEVKQLIEQQFPYQRIHGIINELHARIDSLEAKKPTPKVALKERLMRKITKNSKEYIKSVILGTIKKYGRISGPQLKEIVVEEQGICSKSSFYRLLQEIETEHDIASFTDGKEKTYFLKTQVLK